jgi:hypothetical protein
MNFSLPFCIRETIFALMEILKQENQIHTITDKYCFVINPEAGLTLSAGSLRRVYLTFVNGSIKTVEHDLEQPYIDTPDFWQVMGAIAEKIKAIMKQNT